ncbi:MAG: sulfurtransferase complex subunit TusB [Gammaproteobacteria bacterium]|nr:sulfurtransferase complex subunit TusB [Gammaproteobacteria bacterium]
MPTLHTVNKSAFERNSLESCLAVCKTDASVLLIEDAVVSALQNTSVSEQVSAAANTGIKFFALADDLKARGLPDQRIMDEVTLVDYAGFVKLATENDRVQNWL